MAKFDTRVHFDSVVRANLTFGGLKALEGLSQEELFLWLPVKGISVSDPSSGLILFDIGVAHKQLSLSLFEDPPVCKPQGTTALIISSVLFPQKKNWFFRIPFLKAVNFMGIEPNPLLFWARTN